MDDVAAFEARHQQSMQGVDIAQVGLEFEQIFNEYKGWVVQLTFSASDIFHNLESDLAGGFDRLDTFESAKRFAMALNLLLGIEFNRATVMVTFAKPEHGVLPKVPMFKANVINSNGDRSVDDSERAVAVATECMMRGQWRVYKNDLDIVLGKFNGYFKNGFVAKLNVLPRAMSEPFRTREQAPFSRGDWESHFSTKSDLKEKILKIIGPVGPHDNVQFVAREGQLPRIVMELTSRQVAFLEINWVQASQGDAPKGLCQQWKDACKSDEYPLDFNDVPELDQWLYEKGLDDTATRHAILKLATDEILAEIAKPLGVRGTDEEVPMFSESDNDI